jgi:tetratricopeptide (TPR) repeat protein
MPVFVRRGRPLVACLGLLVLLGACAPRSGGIATAPPPSGVVGEERQAMHADAYLRMGDSARAAGDPAAAIGFYRQAAVMATQRPTPHVRLGQALVEVGAYEDAADAFRAALGLASGNLEARRGLGRALVALNRPEAAMEQYRAVLDQEPGDVRAINGLAVAHDMAGRHDEAQVIYRSGLEIAPDSVLLRNNLGLSLALAGDYDRASGLLRELVDSPGATARYRQNLALVYGLAGDMDSAEHLARMDLDRDAVSNNLAYYAALRGMDNGRETAAAIGTAVPDRPEGEQRARETSQRLQTVALEVEGVDVAMAPSGRWFLNLGQYADSRAAVGAWRQLRVRHADTLGSLGRMAGIEDGRQPLLAGPLASESDARRACTRLAGQGQPCRAVAL